jgi:TolB-like protein/Flp pilus assembly protein TadD
LATGERPFTGETSVAVLSSILKDTPRAVIDLRPDLPRDLSRIIKHCLVKDPESRFQRAKDLRYELVELQRDSEAGDLPVSRGARAEVVTSSSASKRRTRIDSLAVLPFVNVGADPQTEYLSDGITENLINSLSQLAKLRVLPRSTVFRYKGRDLDLQTIGRELTVRAVLMGRVVHRGDILNIQTDLVDVSEDAQLWGHQYTRTLADLIAVQEEIAREVAGKLHLRPTSDEQKRLTQRFTENPAAHQLYLKGRFCWNRRTSQGLHQAAEYFQQAIDADPGYGRAWAGLADTYALYSTYGAGSPREAGPRATEAARRALRIDETLAEAHSALGYALFFHDWDWSGALTEFQRAIALDPRDGVAHLRCGFYWTAMGRLEDTLAAFKRAQALEPLSLVINALLGFGFFWLRRYDRAIEEFRKTLDLDPYFAFAHLGLGRVYEQQARYADAIPALQKALALSDGEARLTAALGHAYAVTGQRGEAEHMLETLRTRSTQQYIDPFHIAIIYLGLREEGPAVEWLERSFEEHSPWLCFVRADWRFDRIRNDPRCRDLFRRMKLPEW